MRVKIGVSRLSGEAVAPPSKSMAHRLILLAALSGGVCKVDNLYASEDVLAMLDCIERLGAEVSFDGKSACINGTYFLKRINPTLNCRESGNTLRFLIPLCLSTGERITFNGSGRLMERPQAVYENLCRERGYEYIRGVNSITVRGGPIGGEYTLDGSVSSQFITGMIMALLHSEEGGIIRILLPFESRSYIDLTLRAVSEFGGKAYFADSDTIFVTGKSLSPKDVITEGDYSNAAFLDAFNFIGGSVKVKGLTENSAQGDRIYQEYFSKLSAGFAELDISDCPDLGPILMAVAAVNYGARLTGTRRLAIKESDRGAAMQEELKKFGIEIIRRENEITIPGSTPHRPSVPIYGHNDHRIVMAASLILTKTGGEICGAEAVRKTYPDFFEVIASLGANIEITEKDN